MTERMIVHSDHTGDFVMLENLWFVWFLTASLSKRRLSESKIYFSRDKAFRQFHNYVAAIKLFDKLYG